MATLTIRGLDEEVKQRLRIVAAEHGQSMEAEAREILARSVEAPGPNFPKARFAHLAGRWMQRGTSDDMMRELRGED